MNVLEPGREQLSLNVTTLLLQTMGSIVCLTAWEMGRWVFFHDMSWKKLICQVPSVCMFAVTAWCMYRESIRRLRFGPSQESETCYFV